MASSATPPLLSGCVSISVSVWSHSRSQRVRAPRTRVAGVPHGSSSGGMDRGCPVGSATARYGGEGACPPTGLRWFGSQRARGYTAAYQTRPTRLQACGVRVLSHDAHAQRRVQRRRVTPSLARKETPQARPGPSLPPTT